MSQSFIWFRHRCHWSYRLGDGRPQKMCYRSSRKKIGKKITKLKAKNDDAFNLSKETGRKRMVEWWLWRAASLFITLTLPMVIVTKHCMHICGLCGILATVVDTQATFSTKWTILIEYNMKEQQELPSNYHSHFLLSHNLQSIRELHYFGQLSRTIFDKFSHWIDRKSHFSRLQPKCHCCLNGNVKTWPNRMHVVYIPAAQNDNPRTIYCSM